MRDCRSISREYVTVVLQYFVAAAEAARWLRQCLLAYHWFKEHHLILMPIVVVLVGFGVDRKSQFSLSCR